jgi:hypothetical protein
VCLLWFFFCYRCGGWDKDVIPVFTIIGRNGYEVYIPSRDVSGETVARIALRHIESGSKI